MCGGEYCREGVIFLLVLVGKDINGNKCNNFEYYGYLWGIIVSVGY